MKHLAVLFMFLILISVSTAQKEAHNWYFGINAGITFNEYKNGLPAALTDGEMVNYGGTASISDKQGNLLFYTNGETVWNKEHEIMENGSGLYGYGNRFYECASQPACILKIPGNKSKYYIFTLDYVHYTFLFSPYNRFGDTSWTKGLRYSIVDMSENGGLGRVTEKNRLIRDHVVDRICIVPHEEPNKYWLIGHDMNSLSFFSYLIDFTGISKKPVISAFSTDYRIEEKYRKFPYWYCRIIGNLKSSADGSKIVSCRFDLYEKITRFINPHLYDAVSYINNSKIELYTFNRKTGKLSDFSFFQDTTLYKGFYGAEFSPDGKYVYATSTNLKGYISDKYDSKLIQIELDSNNSVKKIEDIFNTKKSLGALQLGPDGKIYVACSFSTYLGAIHSPGQPGLKCNFIDSAVYLEYKYCQMGLPAFIYDRAIFEINVPGTAPLCEGSILELKVEIPDYLYEIEYEWTGPSGFSSDEQNPVIENVSVENSGIYYISVSSPSKTFTDSTFIEIFPKPDINIKASPSNILCPRDSVVLSATGSELDKILWNTGDTTKKIIVKYPGNYSVIAESEHGCRDTAQIDIEKSDEVDVMITGELQFCAGDSTILEIENYDPNLKYIWSTGENKESIKVGEPGVYSVQAVNESGCSGYDSVYVEKIPLPEVNIIGETVFCEGGSLNLDLLDYDDYNDILWSTGGKTKRIIVTQAGEYWVEATDSNGCTGTSEPVEIIEAPNPVPAISGAAPICKGDSLNLDLLDYDDYNDILWSTGEKTKRIIVTQPGEYWVEVTDVNGCTGTVYANIELIEIELSGLENVSFGSVLVLNEAQSSLTVSNAGEDAVKIESVGIKGIEGAVFTVETIPEIPVTLEPGESLTINVKFKPDAARVFLDSLIIEILEPCVETRSIACTGSGYELDIESTVRLPELTGEIGDPDFHIPIYAKLDSDTIFTNLSYTAEISFDAALFLPKGITKGNISGSSIAGGERTLVINGFEESLGGEEKILTEIYGLILLGDKDETPLRFDDFSFSNDMPVNKIDGRLRVEGVCIQSLSAIKVFTPTNMTITPNPAGEEVKVKVQTEEEGKFSINIYTIQGIKTETNEWVKTSGGKEEFIINLRIGDYPNGLYQAVLKTPSQVVSSQMVIVK